MKTRTNHRLVITLPKMFRQPAEPYRLGVYSLHPLDIVRLACTVEEAQGWLISPQWRCYLRLLAELVRDNCHRFPVVARLVFDSLDLEACPVEPSQILAALSSRLRDECRLSRISGTGCFRCALAVKRHHARPAEAARKALKAMQAHLHLAPPFVELQPIVVAVPAQSLAHPATVERVAA